MAKKALPLLVVLGALAAVLWTTGVLAPSSATLGPIGETGDAPGDLTPPGAGAPTTAADGEHALAQGGRRPTPRTRAAVTNGPRITGTVVDLAGAPIADAQVLAIPETITRSFRAADVGKPEVPVADAVSDAQGRFVVAASPDAPFHTVVVQTATGATAVESQVRTGADVTITVLASGTWRGVVSDLEGAPIVGARIHVMVALGALDLDLEATSGAGGAYRVPGAPTMSPAFAARRFAQQGVFEVTAEGFASVMLPAAPYPEPGKERERNFVLPRGATLVGKVVDAESGAAVAGARVVLWSPESGVGGTFRAGAKGLAARGAPRIVVETQSDASGAFRLARVPVRGFHGLAANEWGRRGPVYGRVTAWKEGCCPATDEVPIGNDGDTFDVTLKLWAAATIEGRVVDAGGKPAVGASVAAQPSERTTIVLPATLFPELQATGPDGVGADGAYRLPFVPVPRAGPEPVTVVGRLKSPFSGRMRRSGSGNDGTVTVSARAGVVTTAPDLVVTAPESTGAALSVRVRVVAPDGTPVWGAWVGGVGVPTGPAEPTDRDGFTTVTFFSDARRPLNGAQTLQARAKGYALSSGTVTPRAETTESVVITLKVARRVAGRVLAADRQPARQALVAVGDGSQPVAQVFPDPAQARPGEPTAPAPLVSGTRFGGRGPRAQWGNATTDDEGRFVVESLPDGPYHVLAQATSLPGTGTTPRPRATLSDVPSDAANVEIVLPTDTAPPTGTLVGTTRDAQTGRPPAKVLVTVKRGDEVIATVGSGQDGPGDASGVGRAGVGSGSGMPALGRFEFVNVPAGALTVFVTAEGYAGASAPVVVRAAETTSVGPIELQRGIRVFGRVRRADGIPTKGLRHLYFQPLDAPGGAQEGLPVDVKPDGTYELSGFTPGRWRMSSWVDAVGPDDMEQGQTIHEDTPILVLNDAESSVPYDPVLVVGGTLSVQCNDARLPPPPWEGAPPATEEQKRFAAACRATVTDAGGVVIAEQRGGFQRGNAGRLAWIVVLPGRYTVHSQFPGEDEKTQVVEVRAAEQASVVIGAAPGAAPGK